ncbi:MAG: S24/S26 family peptidase [Blautia sp.]|nr:S24/S26 family peptidase [Blautia sp.]
MSTFEEILSRDGRIVYKTKGVSMLPLLHQNQDIVVIEPPQGRLNKYDVALYKRGVSYVLHRVIQVKDHYYLIRGDNTYALEYVPDEAVIGVLRSFIRNGKAWNTDDRCYILYSRFWNAIYPVRKLWVLGWRLIYRVAKKLGLRRPDWMRRRKL